MAKEIKVNPAIRFAASGAAENIGVETAGSFQVGDWEGEVKARVSWFAHGGHLFINQTL